MCTWRVAATSHYYIELLVWGPGDLLILVRHMKHKPSTSELVFWPVVHAVSTDMFVTVVLLEML